MSVFPRLLPVLTLGLAVSSASATQLVELKVLDEGYLMVHFRDGEVTHRDDATGPCAYRGACNDSNSDTVIRYEPELDLATADAAASWTLQSSDDARYGSSGQPVSAVYRKSKLNGMAQQGWDSQANDFHYEYTMEHYLYLRLPEALEEGKSYSLAIASGTGTDVTQEAFTFDPFHNRSEAIHINLAGYSTLEGVKAADLYQWMGSGGPRDYTAFEGNDVYLYNVETGQHQRVGEVTFWKDEAAEMSGYHMVRSPVWNVDFTGFNQPGTYRLAVEGVGCSEDFTIEPTAFEAPYTVSVRGFYYMRIGQADVGLVPVPRQPLYIPGESPADTKVYLTTMQPYHPDWDSFSSGDVWDRPEDWDAYRQDGDPTNPNAWGGHSDALDWDRHLGHVSIIYDLLLPYVLTGGALNDDDLGIAESGNGIPDLLDEARNEVDFWLRLRDGDGYSHGLTNPTGSNVFYQAGATPIAAWANAANAAMLADCFRLAGLSDLQAQYRAAAEEAYHYADQLPDPMLDTLQNVGEADLRGRDFKQLAAAYLYNVTGETAYENVVQAESRATSDTAELAHVGAFNQIWATAGYLQTPQPVHYPDLQAHMRAAVVYQAQQKEVAYSQSRPSRRATDNTTGYFHTIQFVHRTLVAHAVTTDSDQRAAFLDALTLEADWGLGRNPLNLIQMTTATTSLADKRSVTDAYTSGRDDGTPGMHPGHTPYMNTDDWAPAMIMGRPSWMTSKAYPSFDQWPRAEGYFPTRYVWSHTEFTPQQTMRGKMALYGYLYGLEKQNAPAAAPEVTAVEIIDGQPAATLQTEPDHAYQLQSSTDLQTWQPVGAAITGTGSAQQLPLPLQGSGPTFWRVLEQ
ncbi:MAG: cellulase domain-containing protein [Puniceicoccaceae bacterium 5H]|nr:MAG: cellulase domain-containing protein [Puniceicoccaceae bacterium 5H]